MMNRKVGWIDKRRISSFEHLFPFEQKYIAQLVINSTQAVETRDELNAIRDDFFENPEALSKEDRMFFITTLLLG